MSPPSGKPTQAAIGTPGAHAIPPTPWTKLGTDLFEIDGTTYILIVDYHSKFPVVQKLCTTTSGAVANISLQTFSMFGAPRDIISANGTPICGQAVPEHVHILGNQAHYVLTKIHSLHWSGGMRCQNSQSPTKEISAVKAEH